MIYSDGIHIVSDKSLEELHAFAYIFSIARCWFDPNPKHPHYDIPKRRQKNFFETTDATKVSSKEVVRAVRRMKEKMK